MGLSLNHARVRQTFINLFYFIPVVRPVPRPTAVDADAVDADALTSFRLAPPALLLSASCEAPADVLGGSFSLRVTGQPSSVPVLGWLMAICTVFQLTSKLQYLID